MGCVWSLPVERTTEDDIVGATGRHHTQVKIDEVPLPRVDMVALEVLAGQQTLYRRRVRRFKRQGSLDYSADQMLERLRNWLDEPVGRFYLLEFAQQKELPDMARLVDAWVAAHKVRAPRLPTLAEVLERAENEEGSRGSKQAVRGSDADMDGDERRSNSSGSGNVAASGPERDRAASSVRGVPLSASESLANAEKLLDKYLRPGAPQFLGALLAEGVVDEACAAVEQALAKGDAAPLMRGDALPRLENALFRELVARKFHEKFREHSEYKRYKLKLARVYNALSHRDFDFMSTLGKGSFGRVLRVRKKTTGQQLALKVMSKKKILSGAESADQVTIERNVLVVCDCPSIVRVQLAFQTSRALFLALELLDGGTLLDAMHNCGGQLPQDAARFAAAQIALGLEHLHKHGILYRDLKPVNVMLDARGNAVLTDMGLCAKFRESLFPKGEGAISSSGTRLARRKSMIVLKPEELKCVGTFGFRAPELLGVPSQRSERTGYGPAVDWWALGITLHLLLTGKMPFGRKPGRRSMLGLVGGGGGGAAGDPRAHEKKLQNELNLSGELTLEAASVIEALLDRDPENRLGTDPAALRAHPFFAALNWDKLARLELEPPYRPPAPKRDADESPQFDGLAEAMQQFSQDNVLELFGGENEMQEEYTHVGRKQQRLFRDWDFVPDDALAQDWSRLGEDKEFE